jgi:putative ABC transport system permease protein
MLADDIRFAIRRLHRRPVFAAAPIVLSGVGLAACVAAYAVVDGVISQRLGFKDASQLVAIYSVPAEAPSLVPADSRSLQSPVSPGAWRALGQSRMFSEVGGWSPRKVYWGHPSTDVVQSWYVSSSLLQLLGVKPRIGRLFTSDDDTQRRSQAVLISLDCWRGRYGGRRDIIGTPLTFKSTGIGSSPEVRTIVGVFGPELALRGPAPEILFPLSEIAPGRAALAIVARLADDATLQTAQAEATAIVAGASDAARPVVARVMSLEADLLGPAAPPLWLLIAAAGVLLGLTIVSASGLLMSEMYLRQGETSVMLCLGADRRTLVRQSLVEHAIRSLLTASLAVGLALWITRGLSAILPAEVMVGRLTVPVNVMLMGFGAATVTSLLIGVLPSVGLSAVSPARSLIPGRQMSLTAPRLQKGIAIVQLSLSLALLVLSTLLTKTFLNLTAQPLGFPSERLAVVSIRASEAPPVLAAPGQLPVFASWVHTEALLDAVRHIPGVQRAAGVSTAPFGDVQLTRRVRIARPSGALETEVQVQNVTRGYWDTLGVQLTAGRDFENGDRRTDISQTQGAVVVSLALDRLLGGDAVDKAFSDAASGATYKVIGVVRNVKHNAQTDDDLPTMYGLSATYDGVSQLLIRTAQTPESLFPTIRQTIRTYDPSVLVTGMTTMEAMVAEKSSVQRFRATAAVVLSATALFLALAGVNALGQRLVQTRRHEIGIRLALGSPARHIVGVVLKDIVQIGLWSVAVGAAMAIVLGTAMRSLLIGVSPMDAGAFIVSVSLLLCGMAGALAIPTRRALHVDPLTVLRLGQ